VTIPHRVRLPRGAEAWAAVEPDDVLATRRAPTKARSVPIARPLRIASDQVAASIVVRPGTTVAAGEPLAEHGKRQVRAPVACLFVGWDPDDGTALIAPFDVPQPIHGHVRGRVESVADDEMVLAVNGVALEGVGGMGEVVHGELHVAVHDPGDELRASAIDVGASGRIVVGGSRASTETLIRARAMGVAGIVVGGLRDKELRDFDAIQRRRKEVESAGRGFGILLLEGYGKVGFDPGMFAWFRRHEGRLATLFAADRRMYVHDADPPPRRALLAREGDSVIARRRPYGGRAGRIIRVLDRPYAAPSGAIVHMALVRFEDGRIAAVPMANLEATAPAGD
jgi:hypothetical protein